LPWSSPAIAISGTEEQQPARLATPQTEEIAMFPDQLTKGYRAFLESRLPKERERYRQLGEKGQRPEIMVIGCCDSRVSPDVIFDAAPGELFIVRNVANLVPPYETGGDYHGTSAALEFAVQALRVKHIVVLGHASCGGIRAFADDAEPLSPGNFIGNWMSLVKPAADSLGPRRGDDYLQRLELAAVGLSLANLMTFPCVKILVEQGRLHLHGAYFGVASGQLLIRDPETGAFTPAVEDGPDRVSLLSCR
jgi:carbonic anhydrase